MPFQEKTKEAKQKYTVLSQKPLGNKVLDNNNESAKPEASVLALLTFWTG